MKSCNWTINCKLWIIDVMTSKRKIKKINKELTIKEVSSKLNISEATVRKYIKDFALDSIKGNGNKAIVSKDTMQILAEIAKLRENGLSIQEIKDLKGNDLNNLVKENSDEDEVDVDSADDKDEELENENIDSEPVLNGSSLKAEDSEDESFSDEDLDELEDEEPENEEESENEEDADDENLVPSDENVIAEENELISVEDSQDENNEEDDEEPEDNEEVQDSSKPRRRMTFNYRYVERQVSNDSKRINSIRQRLKNPSISTQERLFYEEALDRRILFLNGWKHILRWITLNK